MIQQLFLAQRKFQVVDKFNELRATIENEIYSADASVDNKGALEIC